MEWNGGVDGMGMGEGVGEVMSERRGGEEMGVE